MNKVLIKRLPALLTAMIIFSTLVPTVYSAEDVSNTPIRLVIGSEEIALKNPCFAEDGVVYFPMKEVFFRLGIYMEWDELEKCWIGKGNNGEIRAAADKPYVEIDWVNVELPAPTREKDGILYLPSYIIEDATATEPARYDESTNTLYITPPGLETRAKSDFSLAAVEKTLPEGDELMDPEQMFNMSYDNGPDYIKFEQVDVEGDLPFDKALRIETLPYKDGAVPAAIYNIQLSTTIRKGDFLSGDVGIMTFWARAVKITDESGTAGFKPTYEQLDTWNKAQDSDVKIGSTEWKKFYLPLYSGRHSLYANKSRVAFAVGYKPQIIEIADIHIRNFHNEVELSTVWPDNTVDYKGIEEDALWRKEAYRRIEKYRKNDMIVTVKDENGNPVKGATVNADMTENEFMYGLALCSSEIVDLYPEDSKVAAIKDRVMREAINTGVEAMDLKESPTDKIEARRDVNEFYNRGLRQRGHALTWGSFRLRNYNSDKTPREGLRDYPNVSYEKIYDYLMTEVKKEVWMFKDIMSQWDVLNEPFDSADLRNVYGTQIYSDAFKITKALDPKAKCYLNETGMEGHPNREHTMRAKGLIPIVTNMIENERAPIDGLGVQGHCVNYYYPQGFYNELDYLAQYVDEVAVTEYDFYNEDLSRAPEHLRDTFLATFSHPKATCFIIWGYQDNMHWRGVGPFYDRQWQKKPAYDEWLRIVNDEFCDKLTAVTDENGRAVLRGLRGKYRVTVTADGKKGDCDFTLTKSDRPERDNYVNASLSADKVILSPSNGCEVYSKGPVKFRTGQEAYADYLSTVGDKTPIGIYKHKDSNGNRVPETTDGLQNSYWYGENDGDYVEYELVEQAVRGDVSVDFRAANGEIYGYKVFKSADGEKWDEIYSGSSANRVKIPFEDAMFIRIQSDGNKYMGISEVNINAEK